MAPYERQAKEIPMTEKVWPCQHRNILTMEGKSVKIEDSLEGVCYICGARRPEEQKKLAERLCEANLNLQENHYILMAEEAVRAFEEVIDGMEFPGGLGTSIHIKKGLKQKLRELL